MRAFGAVSAASVLSGCGGGSSQNDGGVSVCIASEPENIDPCFNTTVDGATYILHLFAGLAKWEKQGEKFITVPECATELPEPTKNDDGSVTYTYTLKDGLKWSDGKDLTAADFAFAWQRASNVSTGSEYQTMFQGIKGYSDDDPNAQLAVEAVDDKTLTVTLDNYLAYWNEILAFPTLMPAREDLVSNESWATDASTYVSNGAYTMTGWDHDSVITLEKNPNYHDADKVTMDKIKFYLSSDSNNMLSNFKNGTWQLIDDIPTNEMETLKGEYPDEFKIDPQIGTYYCCWNVNKDILPAGKTFSPEEAEIARADVRCALSKLLDRNYIVEQITQAGQVPASSFVPIGVKQPDGSEFYENAGSSKDFKGYYNVAPEAHEANFNEAVETLKKYYTFDESAGVFTDFPSITFLYNTSDAHKAIAEYLQGAFKQVGIDMQLENQEWNTFLNTRNAGDYIVARSGWLADYTDPICFLDMWVTASGNNDVFFGRDAHADLKIYSVDTTDLGYSLKVDKGTWKETYDALIALVKSETDNDKRFALMHKAEDLLMSTGAITPLYFYTDSYMISKKLKGLFSIPLGFKLFTYTTIEE